MPRDHGDAGKDSQTCLGDGSVHLRVCACRCTRVCMYACVGVTCQLPRLLQAALEPGRQLGRERDFPGWVHTSAVPDLSAAESPLRPPLPSPLLSSTLDAALSRAPAGAVTAAPSHSAHRDKRNRNPEGCKPGQPWEGGAQVRPGWKVGVRPVGMEEKLPGGRRQGQSQPLCRA